MRINLVTPFAEKDAVKDLGARWDATKKCWYVVDVKNLAPFARWIPNLEAAVDVPGASSTVSKPKLSPPVSSEAPVPPASGAADCGCDVLPWDDCIHTATA